jgi:hypothetical protein
LHKYHLEREKILLKTATRDAGMPLKWDGGIPHPILGGYQITYLETLKLVLIDVLEHFSENTGSHARHHA